MQMHTLHVEHAVLLLVYTALTLTGSLLYRGMKGIHWFTLYNVFALLGAVCVVLRGAIPDFLSIVVGNLFVVAAYFVLFLSLSAPFGRRRFPLYSQCALLLVALVTMLQYGLLHPDTGRRLLAYSLVLGLMQALTVTFILRRDPVLRRVGIPLAFMLGALAITNLVRIIDVLHDGVPADYLQAGPLLAWIVVVNSCLQCGAVVAYVWMTAAMLRRDLEKLASTDPLTGLLNRRAFEIAAERQLVLSRLTGTSVAAIVIDLDCFKPINDSFGHQFGDVTLTEAAHCLRGCTRAADSLARIGGDEFAVLLPDTGEAAAWKMAEHMRHCLESLEIVHGEQQTAVTASFGVAQTTRGAMSLDDLVRACDTALYRAKSGGGNRCAQSAMATEREGSTSALQPEFL